VAEAEGFLVEAPLTWYASRQAWDLSPGYEEPRHKGFSRAMEADCLFCHAGRAETIGDSVHRFEIKEAALSCERCHGPGSLHVARHTGNAERGEPAEAAPKKNNQTNGSALRAPHSALAFDDTIVNPAHLPRHLADAICQQCHLQGKGSPQARGRKQTDFRPGLPLQEFQHDYSVPKSDASLAVIGHVEQLQRSPCYQGSETLSCLTCHNPHGEPKAEDRVAYYRSTCLECHAPERCKVDPQRRQMESPGNDCVQCHMPRSATDIPHVAFTNHRIGVHGKPFPSQQETAGLGELRPIFDLSGLSALDRQRSLGLAYSLWAIQEKDAAQAAVCRARAAELLTGVRAAGLHDPMVDIVLVRLGSPIELLEPYIGDAAPADLTPQDRCAALSLYASARAKQGRCADALPLLRQVVSRRRVSEDWQILAYCERTLGNIPQSVEALEMAVTIDTRLDAARELLAPYYRQRGDLQRAALHQRRMAPASK
jgi:hypothetical protein